MRPQHTRNLKLLYSIMQFKSIDAPTDGSTDTLTDAPMDVLTDTLTVATKEMPRDALTECRQTH